MNTRLIRAAALSTIALLTLTLVSCSKGVDGKYVSDGGVMTIEFKSGKATISAIGSPAVTVNYTVDGDKITVDSPVPNDKTPMVLTRMQDGSLQGGLMTFKKAAT